MAHHVKKAVVIGLPVKHSLSPVLHGYWLKYYGVTGSYEKIELLPEELGAFFHQMRISGELAGCNITVPHKESAMPYVDSITPVADRVGAINTVVVTEKGELLGDNTDVYGFIQNIKTSVPDWQFHGRVAMVLGAGGAAKAVVAGLLEEGVSRILITNRTEAHAESIALKYGEKVVVVPWEEKESFLPQAEMLVNTTLLGMEGQKPLEISLLGLPPHALVTDIVYRPLITPLLHEASRQGYRVVDGLGMLLYQAVPGFKSWFGVEPEVTAELRSHILQAL